MSSQAFRRKGVRGFTLIELLAVVLIIGLMASTLLPALAREKQKVRRMQCMDNLKGTGLAFKLWSFDQGGKSFTSSETNSERPMVPAAAADGAFRCFQTMSNELSTPEKLICPADTRVAAPDFGGRFADTNISYFVGLDAKDSVPAEFLAGDRNLRIVLPPDGHLVVLNAETMEGWTRELHNNVGNILFTDGSVQPYSGSRLKQAVQGAGGKVRLIMP